MNSNSENARDIVLNFYDALLRRCDVDLLNGPFWLNDEIIAFAYEYFAYRQFADIVQKIGFVTPSVVQLLKFCDERSSVDVLEPLKLGEKSLLFFPINDSESDEYAGGSHWSLLIYRRATDSFYHFDSIPGSGNFDIAVSITKKITSAVGSDRKDPTTIPVSCTVQKNGYDCGVFCILFTETLAERYRTQGEEIVLEIKDIPSEEISKYRSGLKSLIESLRVGH